MQCNDACAFWRVFAIQDFWSLALCSAIGPNIAYRCFLYSRPTVTLLWRHETFGSGGGPGQVIFGGGA